VENEADGRLGDFESGAFGVSFKKRNFRKERGKNLENGSESGKGTLRKESWDKQVERKKVKNVGEKKNKRVRHRVKRVATLSASSLGA
jgi:hypothetical protein